MTPTFCASEDFGTLHVSKDDWVFENGENPSAQMTEQIESNLELMREAAGKSELQAA
jgi:hypothetical protein